KAVIDYKAKYQMTELAGTGRLISERQLTELNAQLAIARSKLAEARSKVDAVNGALKDITETSSLNGVGLDAFNNQLLTKLRLQYLDLASREAEWSEKYGRNHQATVNVRKNMAGVRATITAELQQLAATYKSEYDLAKGAEGRLEQDVQD